jgi:predicted RNase H-like HicB family nuclease
MFDVWYWAILERNKAGRYFAHVPDLSGATAAGDSERDVLQNIAEIAADHVRDTVESGQPVPVARSVGDIPRDPEVKEYGRAAIPVDVPGRSVKISLSIDEALLNRADHAAKQVGMSRSGFFADSVLQKITQLAKPRAAAGGFAEAGRSFAPRPGMPAEAGLFYLTPISPDQLAPPTRTGSARRGRKSRS